MTTDPHGWPDPARPGYPKHPERDGWHWLKHPEDLRPFPSPWNAELGGWPSGALHSPQGIIDLGFTYLAPCLTPAEVAAAVQAEREACLRLIDQHQSVAREVIGRNPENREAVGGVWATAECASAIRARGDTSALDAALAQARREGMEEAARIVESVSEWQGQDYYCDSCKGGAIYPDREDVAAKIRSAAGEGGK